MDVGYGSNHDIDNMPETKHSICSPEAAYLRVA